MEFHYDLMTFLKLQVNIKWKIMFMDSPSYTAMYPAGFFKVIIDYLILL